MLRYFHPDENFTARRFNGYPQDNFMKDSREPLATASAHSSFSMWGLSRPGLQAVGLALAHMMRSVQLDMYDCVKRLT